MAKSAGTVGGEALNIRGRVRNRRWTKALSDAGMGSFPTELAWQCTPRGVLWVEADRRFPSTQVCACCGCRSDAQLALGVRVYRCSCCGWECDRDANAALNLAAWEPPMRPGRLSTGMETVSAVRVRTRDATVGAVPSDGTPVDWQRSAWIVPHRR